MNIILTDSESRNLTAVKRTNSSLVEMIETILLRAREEARDEGETATDKATIFRAQGRSRTLSSLMGLFKAAEVQDAKRIEKERRK